VGPLCSSQQSFQPQTLGCKGYFVFEKDLPPEACQQCKKNFASRQNISGSKLADAGHSTVLGDPFQ